MSRNNSYKSLQLQNGEDLCGLALLAHHFPNNSHPKDIGAKDIAELLTYLEVERRVSTSTQTQVLNLICETLLQYETC